MTQSIVKESPLLKLIPHRSITQFAGNIKEWTSIVESVLQKSSLPDKLQVLDDLLIVQDFFSLRPYLSVWVQSLSLLEHYLVKSLVVIHQAERCFAFPDAEVQNHERALMNMLSELKEVEAFYSEMGGVIGYHLMSMSLLADQDTGRQLEAKETYFPPFGVDLTQDSLDLRKKIIDGIASQKFMAELYPVGGAADRLNLQDEQTHTDLPAARLEFLGYTLLEWMIRDLQAREYVHFKLFHEQVTTPIALMTSPEKNNNYLVQEIVREKRFFGRSPELFMFFFQPLVPTFTKEGAWCLHSPMKLLLKPGGHGVIWKLAAEKRVFQWLAEHGRYKALVRQINNPIAGVDLGLIALTGVGCSENKTFGFASCVRRVLTSEGMNILKQKPSSDGSFRIVLSNIEYCDFKKFGIQDIAKNADEPYSVFPSNTNILFVDLTAISEVIKTLAYPGMLVNFKKMECFDVQQGMVQVEVARLELLMQNIADGLVETVQKPLEEDPYPQLKTFITFNKRHKTISPTKKQFIPGSGLVETALGCFYDYLKNARELLEQFCDFTMPPLVQEEEFLEQGPSFMVLYHPALGPLYSIIGQKIRKGSLAAYSELQLEVADVSIEGLSLRGSLLIKADQVLGHSVEGIVRYSHQTGRCLLKNVTVKNQGIDRSQKNVYWKNVIARTEACVIHLEGSSEFVAEDVVLEGNYMITVQDGERVTARQAGDQVILVRERLDQIDEACWDYSVTSEYHIQLKLKKRWQ
jgi:UTP---glucose-1-phosphate uridylyltransferase